MNTSKKGIELIKEFESLRLKPYYCSAEVLTIGYGHTQGVKKGMTIIEQQAEEYLTMDLMITERFVNWLNIKVNQLQFDALISFAFNLGIGNLQKSTLLKKVRGNPNDFKIANEFIKWIYADGKPLRGLLLRRLAEAKLYFGWKY